LMLSHDIDIRLNTTVSRIRVEAGCAIGVELEGGNFVPAGLVISDADPAYLYSRMLTKVPIVPKLKLKAAQYSMGLFVLYFGTTKMFPDVAHHTIWFGDRYRELLRDIFHRHRLGSDFSLYVHRPTATDPSFAPVGCDSFYVLAPVPNLQSETDWNTAAESYGDSIVRALDETMMPGLRDCITARFHMTPKDFEQRYHSVHGAGFSIAPIFRQSAWFRFHNRAEGIRNLFLVGAGTHPGAGLPGVISSAKAVDHMIPRAGV
jgi:phytoene desaturase